MKTWAYSPVRRVSVKICDLQVSLVSQDGVTWKGRLNTTSLPNGVHDLEATAIGENGKEHSSSIRLRVGPMPKRSFAKVDQENAIGEWSERGLLGTQLGPNKNGKKW